MLHDGRDAIFVLSLGSGGRAAEGREEADAPLAPPAPVRRPRHRNGGAAGPPGGSERRRRRCAGRPSPPSAPAWASRWGGCAGRRRRASRPPRRPARLLRPAAVRSPMCRARSTTAPAIAAERPGGRRVGHEPGPPGCSLADRLEPVGPEPVGPAAGNLVPAPTGRLHSGLGADSGHGACGSAPSARRAAQPGRRGGGAPPGGAVRPTSRSASSRRRPQRVRSGGPGGRAGW